MQSIKEYFKKIKPYEADLIISLTIVLVAFLSFGLGRLSKIEESRVPMTIGNMGASAIDSKVKELDAKLSSSIDSSGSIVASKSGAKYHFPWCSGALRIKDENKVWFQSEEEARMAGYEPAANCKGLK